MQIRPAADTDRTIDGSHWGALTRGASIRSQSTSLDSPLDRPPRSACCTSSRPSHLSATMATCPVDRAWADAVAAVFPDEYNRMYAAVCKHPEPETLARLLLDLANHKSHPPSDLSANSSKKRKLDVEPRPTTAVNGDAHAGAIPNPTVAFECKDVSFQMPARKKLKLQFVTDAADARNAAVQLLHPQTGDIEHTVPVAQLEQVCCLPVPEKQQRQWNFCLIPTAAVAADGRPPPEQVVFTMNETPPVGASPLRGDDGETYVSVAEAQLNALLRPHGRHVVRPSEAEFASSIAQPHRKGEKAFHVKAHRGSKDGYLFLLPSGVLFGFKKPLAFFPLAAIDAVSYTSVLQRTFNLVVTTTTTTTSAPTTAVKEEDDEAGTVGAAAASTDTEFGMLDQADFAGIDAYVKRHGLNDASMAQARRAKAYNVNKPVARGEAATGGGGGEDLATTAMSPLTRSQAMAPYKPRKIEPGACLAHDEGLDPSDVSSNSSSFRDSQLADDLAHSLQSPSFGFP
nr:histone chaperone [Quercus suber]